MSDSRALAVYPPVMDINCCASYLQISPDTLYKYASDGVIPAFKLGNRWRFRKESVDAAIERMQDEAAEEKGKGKAK